MPLIAKINKIKVQPRQVVQDDLVAWWKFRECGYTSGTKRLLDSSNAGTHRMELYTGNVFSFDGSNDRVTFDNRAEFDLDNSWSWAFMVKPNSTQSNSTPGLVNYGDESASGSGYVIDFGPTSGWTAGFCDIRLIWDGNTIELTDGLKTDAWNAVCLSYDGTTLRIFIDGRERLSTTVDLSSYPRSWSGDLTLGLGSSTGTQYAAMELAYARLWTAGLTHAEWRNLWRQPENNLPHSVASSALKFDAWGCEGINLLTVLEGVSPDEGTGDISGATVETEQGPPVPQPGISRCRFAPAFNGSTIYADHGAPLPSADDTDFTYAAWIMVTSTGVRTIIGSSNNGYSLQTQNGTVTLGKQGASAIVSKASAHTLGSICHIVATRSGDDYTLYVDGASVATATDSTAITVANLRIGATATGGNKFIGIIFEVAIWEGRAVSSDEVSDLFNLVKDPGQIGLEGELQLWTQPEGDGEWKDLSGQSNHLTAPPTVANVVAVPEAMYPVPYPYPDQYFLALRDGAYAHADDHADLDLSTALTLETWFYALNDAGGVQSLISKTDSSTEHSWDLQINPGSDTIRLVASSDGSATTNVDATSISTPFNQWNHLAVTFDGSSVKFYLNGELEHTDSSPGFTALHVGTADVYLGATAGSSNGLYGKLAETKLYSAALVQARIRRNFEKHRETYPVL